MGVSADSPEYCQYRIGLGSAAKTPEVMVNAINYILNRKSPEVTPEKSGVT